VLGDELRSEAKEPGAGGPPRTQLDGEKARSLVGRPFRGFRVTGGQSRLRGDKHQLGSPDGGKVRFG
jgi:hypothetical protein